MNKKPEIIINKNSKKYTRGPIVLIGPPGIGKSTIGEKVANKINIPFYDLDDIISERADKKTSKEIVNKHGRPYFWKLCHLCLKEIFRKKKFFVLACGGGATFHREKGDLKDKNKLLLKKHAFTICLFPSRNFDESIDLLWPRQKDGKRIEIKKSNLKKTYVNDGFEQYIKDADITIYTHHAPIEKIVSSVLKVL